MIDKAAFTKWLQDNKDTYFTTFDSKECPIACYLKATAGGRVDVDPEYAVLDQTVKELPSWVKAFIDKVDRTRIDSDGYKISQLVYGKELLGFLDEPN